MSSGPTEPGAERIEPAHPGKIVTVLSVSAAEADHRALRHLFHHTNWKLLECWNCAEAQQIVRSDPVPVIICDTHLPDGAWTDVLDCASALACPPLVIVTSRLADDRLWAEVMNAGAWDILEKPFHQDELVRVVSLAWLSWKDNLRRAGPSRQVNSAS